MINKVLLTVCAVFFTVNLSLSADTGEKLELTLTLDQAWKMMQESNSELRKLHMELGGAVRKADAYDQLIPSVSTGATLRRDSPFISTYTMPSSSIQDEQELWTARSFLDIQLKLTPGLSIEEELQQLSADLLELEIAGRISSLKSDLTILYYEILSGEKRIALQEENLLLAQNRLTQTELQYEQGLKSDLELLSAKIGAAKDIPGLRGEKTAQDKRYIKLSNYLDLDEIRKIELIPSDLDESLFPDRESVLNSAPLNIDMLISEKQIRQAELNLKKAKREIRGLSLVMSLGVSTSVDPAFQSDSWTTEEWSDNLGLGFSLTLPLDGFIKGSTDQLKLKELEEAIEAARITRDETGRSLSDEVYSLYLDIDLSLSNIEVDELNVSLLEQNYSKMEQSYNNGRVSLSDLDDSRQELKEAVLTLEDEKLNLTKLKIELLRLLNLN